MSAPLYKISASILEQYRLTVLGAYNKNADSLIEYIIGDFVPNEAVSRGQAYHEMIEHGPEKYYWSAEQLNEALVGGQKQHKKGAYVVPEPKFGVTWQFSPAAVLPIFELREKYQGLTPEVWSELNFTVGGKKIVIKLRLDGLHGYNLHEYKTTKRKPKAHDEDGLGYLDSIQHKCYIASMPELKEVNYHIFQLNKANTKCQYHHIKWVKTGMEFQDVYELAGGLMSWLESHPAVLAQLEYVRYKSR